MSSPAPLPLAVLGAGRAGLAHAALVARTQGARLVAVVDPADEARERAADEGLPVAPDLDALPEPVAGVVVAGGFVRQGAIVEEAAARTLPVLLARPLAATILDARRVRAAAEAAGVPLLVGHHRRHHAVVGAAREAVRGGLLGRLVAVEALWALRTPDPGVRWAWRVESGGGAAFVQLVHEIDLLRHLAGEIAEVVAFSSYAESKGARIDAGALALRFGSGALGTAMLADSGLSPWGWEAATSESPDIHPTGEDCLRLVGAEGSLSLPSLAYWRFAGEGRGDAGKPLMKLPMPCPPTDPLAAQLVHFLAVARGEVAPAVPVAEGMASLAAALASFEAAREGRAVAPDPERLGPWEAAAEAIAARGPR